MSHSQNTLSFPVNAVAIGASAKLSTPDQEFASFFLGLLPEAG